MSQNEQDDEEDDKKSVTGGDKEKGSERDEGDEGGKDDKAEGGKKIESIEDEQESGTSIPERVTLAVSVLTVAAIVGALLWQGYGSLGGNGKIGGTTKPDAGPRAVAQVLPVEARRDPRTREWIVPVEVENTGGVALEEVTVKVTLTGADGKPDETELSFSYLPERATETAYAVSETDPAKTKPAARVVSFKTQKNARGY